MHDAHQQELEVFQTATGQAPFNEWLESIRDKTTRNRIRVHLDRLEAGNFGNCQSVKDGVFELCLHFGKGYRIYFGKVDNTIVLLLCGGDKSRQSQDIRRAKAYWRDYQEAQR